MTPRASLARLLAHSHPARIGRIASCLLATLAWGITATTTTAAAASNPSAPAPLAPLFPTDGVPAGWTARSWNDVSFPAPPSANWLVSEGVLKGSVPRGTWLVSPREYGDFVLEFEFRLGERGQGGVGLRFPMRGDPSAEGLEIQMVDPRYFPTNLTVQPWETTGALYKAVAPSANAYKPLEWNHYSIVCQASRISVTLNGTKVIDVDLSQPTDSPEPVRGKPLVERPVRGRIGFLEASRGASQVEIRNARIRELTGPTAPR